MLIAPPSALYRRCTQSPTGEAMSENETLDEAKRNIVDEFTFLGDWMLRYEHIIDLAGASPDGRSRECIAITRFATNAIHKTSPGRPY